jgi:Ca2+-transporting ATPase
MYLGPQFLPMLPAAILYINLASDRPAALALASPSRQGHHACGRARDPNESVFSFDVRTLILLGR